jgi:LPS sulfotransferase NodH
MTRTPRRFCILTSQRSGSTWLVTLLRTVPGVAAHHELFLPHSPRSDHAWLLEGSPPGFVDAGADLGRRPASVRRYLARVEHAGRGETATGFKLMINQALRYFPETLPLLRMRGYRFVLLTRDPLAMAISRYIAQTSRQSHSSADVAVDTLWIDPAWARRDIRKRKLEFRLARTALTALGATWLTVDYDELRNAPDAALDRIAGGLDLPAAPAPDTAPTRKIVSRSYSEVVQNYAELRAVAARENVGPDGRTRARSDAPGTGR